MVIFIVMDFFGHAAVSHGARQHAQAMIEAGHKVTVITDAPETGPGQVARRKFEDQLRIVTIKSIFLNRYYLIGKELSFAFQIYYYLNKLSKNNEIKLIVSQVSGACFGMVKFASVRNIPSVFVIRALINDRIAQKVNSYNWLTTALYKATNHFALNKVKYHLAVSEYIKKKAIGYGAQKKTTFVLHNPVDVKRFNPGQGAQKDIDLLYIGRHSIEKGISVILEAAKALPAETKMVIIGDGQLRSYFERKARGLSCTVEFTGWVDNKLLPKFIQRSKLQLVPSISEAQGRVVLEAMACGVPVIGSKAGGIPEMIQDGKNGWLVPPNDIDALSKTIMTALSNNKMRIAAGKSALETAKRFSINEFNQKLVKIYEEMIMNNPA